MYERRFMHVRRMCMAYVPLLCILASNRLKIHGIRHAVAYTVIWAELNTNATACLFQQFQHHFSGPQWQLVFYFSSLITSTIAETAGEALARRAEVVNIPDYEPVVYEKTQFNGKPTCTEKTWKNWTIHQISYISWVRDMLTYRTLTLTSTLLQQSGKWQ